MILSLSLQCIISTIKVFRLVHVKVAPGFVAGVAQAMPRPTGSASSAGVKIPKHYTCSRPLRVMRPLSLPGPGALEPGDPPRSGGRQPGLCPGFLSPPCPAFDCALRAPVTRTFGCLPTYWYPSAFDCLPPDFYQCGF